MEQKSSTYEADSRSPLKKLNLKNNKQVDECDNQRKNVHLFDIEASILENSVMVPAYFDPGENIKLDNGDQTNQENLNPRYFVLNNFDPILCQEAGDDEILRSAHDNCVPRSLLSHSFDEHLLDENSDSSGDNKTFVTEIVNDYVEKATELSETRNGIEISNTIELNLNNVYNNAETLNESLIIPTEILQVADVANSNDLFDASSSLNNRYLRSPKSDIANRHVLNINIINPLNITSSLKSDTTLEDKINWSDTKEKQFSDFVEQTLVNEASYEHSILESTLLNETNTQNDSKLMKTSSAYDSLVLKFHSLELSDISESTVHTYDEDLENKNYSSETMNEKPVEEKLETANIIHENNCANTKTEEIVAVSTLIQEKMQMSTTEQRSEVNESVVGNKASMEPSATCTNEMSEIINQDECFEKESCLLNSTVNDTAECEKYKMQILELKEELKSCRQKTVALECEVVNIKRKENELNVILEEYKQSAINKDEQLKCLEAKEELLKNEMKELIKQHEIKLKELQRKDIDEQDEQLKYMQTNEEMLKNEIKDLKAFIKQNEIQSQSDLKIGRVMEEYEKSISSLIKENEKMKKERDTAQMHLANIEMAFSDVHQKYERCKAIVQGYKDNEESFKQDIAMNRETIAIQEQKYETLKAHAMAQLEKSNQELAAMRKQHDTEMARLTAQLKRYEIKNMSLMESLQQKAKECEQLSAVCDEFIGNV